MFGSSGPSYISMITFPGVVMHEIAHRFFCDISKVPVYEVAYFRNGNPVGFVAHGEIKNLKDAFLISVGPFIINSLFCAFLTFPCFFPSALGFNSGFAFSLLAWLGLSIGMHAFPSSHDMDSFTNQVKVANNKTMLYFLALPFSVIFALANALRVIWFDLIYAAIIGLLIPRMLL